jgi:hypothetical protein
MDERTDSWHVSFLAIFLPQNSCCFAVFISKKDNLGISLCVEETVRRNRSELRAFVVFEACEKAMPVARD